MADRIGQHLGNYRLTRLLGQGGFAEVYLGEHVYLKTPVAIKVLHTQVAPEDMAQFQQEARILAGLKHPHVVSILDFGIAGQTPYLMMSYAPHGTLRMRHPKGSRLPMSTVISYVKQVAEGLQYAHMRRIVHRDIKPENMLIGEQNEILLSDFGIALIAQSSRYQNTMDMAGTVAYMAPEQIAGHPRMASDQYALGVVVYEWLCGMRPFRGSLAEIAVQHSVTPPPSLMRYLPTLLPEVEQVVMTALAKRPEDRFTSVSAFANALELANQSHLPTERAHGASFSSQLPPADLPVWSPAAASPRAESLSQPIVTPSSRSSIPVTTAEISSDRSGPKTLHEPVRVSHRKRGVSQRFLRLMLAGLVIVALASGLIWFTISYSASPGSITEFAVSTSASVPEGIAAGPDGNLWFTEYSGNKIGHISTSGVITEFPVPALASGPSGITAGPDGSLWFTEYKSSNIGQVSISGTFTEYAVPTPTSYPLGITAGPDGNLWFTEHNSSKIGRISPSGAIAEYVVPTSASYPEGIAAGPDGNLWFTENDSNKIGRITTSGAITEYAVPTPTSYPEGITAGPDGNLWFTENNSSKIGRVNTSGAITEFSLPTSAAVPWGIAAGRDGNLWFTEHDGNKIGCISTKGTITEFSLPTSADILWGIAAGRDGNLWFTEQGGNRIGRITSSK